ncbi:hypothetical protein Javan140_0056 [Streptococcus phage Javan140]|nr:hypothetical protein Javan140_0056 [Streptococcus phage Javan140]
MGKKPKTINLSMEYKERRGLLVAISPFSSFVEHLNVGVLKI